jgi:SSS family transporter
MEQIKTLGGIDYTAIFFFFAMMIGAGIYFFFKTKKSGDFFVGGRIIPGWISGLSYFMTCFSAMAFVGGASLTYHHGGFALFYTVCCSVVFLFCVPIAARWHRANITTVPEYLNQRFGPSTRFLYAIVGIPSRILDNGNRIYATSVFVGAALGIGKGMGLWGSSFIILVYTFMGGIWAVVATDTIQFFLMTMAVLLVSLLGLHALGGLGSFVSGAPDGFWTIFPTDQFCLSYAVALMMILFINANGYWALIQRYSATPTEWEAKKVPLISAFSYLLIMPLIGLPAMIARQAIPGAIDELVASGLAPLVAGERSFILVCMKFLPAGIMGFIVIAIFSATMSALSSEYNIISAVCTKDIYQGLIKRNKKVADNLLLWIGRYSTIGIAVFCTIIGSQVDKLGGAWHFMVAVLALTSAPTYLPALLGLFYRKTPAWGANLAFFLGLVSGIIVKFGLDLPLIYLVSTNVTVTVGTCLVSGLISPVAGERKKLVDELFERLVKPEKREPAGEKSELDKQTLAKAPNINGVIGAGCTLFALFLVVASIVTRADGGFLPNFICAIGLGGIGAVLLYKPSNR